MIRKATVVDAQVIQGLINRFTKEGKLLPRSLSEIYDHLRDFSLYESEDHHIRGVCALHICWDNLAEIRSLAVENEEREKGMGKQLVEACLQEARRLGISRVFLLTYIPSYFERAGFQTVDKSTLPHKIWADCVRCINFPNCDEIAMILEL